jgi:curli biogenesis system outer membrane secretion channel CsgG
MQALSDSDWFLPVEREGLQNILTERKIIRASLQSNKKKGEDVKDLPPLTTSKILIEGGIISYDSNIKTGGFGAEYFGIGASELYREDLISVYMRAVDVRSGQVLVSVSTSKKVLSKEVRAGFFRYVSFKRLAEAEGGYTTNEPMHLCVTQTIEKAITELILKGIDRKVWRSAGSTVAQTHKAQPKQLKKLVKKNKSQVKKTIYFDYDKIEISKQADKTLSSHAAYLVANPEKKVKLEGHADERGNAKYNMSLGKDRAVAAAKHLLQKGVAADQMLITSLGEKHPVKEGSSKVAYSSNRRVELKPVYP